jgi:hypothetical protein
MPRRQLSALLLCIAAGCSCQRPGPAPRLESYARGAFGVRIPPRERIAQRYLLVGDRLPELRKRAQGNWPAWQRLRRWADESSSKGPENLALAYLIGQKREHARAAFRAAEELMKHDVRSDSYLDFGNDMRGVALVLDYCASALDDAERRRLADYLDRWTHELWLDNRGSGWGLDDPGNNYYAAFLEGTAFAAFALHKIGHAHAESYLRLLYDKIEAPNGLMPYLVARGDGGDWSEGANYGQRAKQRLVSALAVVASMGGPDFAGAVPFFRDSIRFAMYQLQPDRRSLYPSGDLARDSAMTVSPYDRDYLATTAFLVADPEARAAARWYLGEVASSYSEGGFRWPEALYKDVLFDVGATPVRKPDELPREYLARGNGTWFIRSDWSPDATALTVSGSPIVDQSHQHHDVGSFTLFKGGWQAVDAASFSKSGLAWESGAHNMVHVAGQERRPAHVLGFTALAHEGAVAYARVDATGTYAMRRNKREVPLVSEATRELVYLEPDTLVVYDRVRPEEGRAYDWRLHFAERPALDGRRVTARHERGAITAVLLAGGEPSIRRDDDIESGPSEAWRLEVAPAAGADAGRFLAVVRVGLGDPPALDVTRIDGDEVDGVVVDGTAVVFSRRPFGAAPDTARWHWRGRVTKHVIGDAPEKCDLVVSETSAELRPGSSQTARNGMIVLQGAGVR